MKFIRKIDDLHQKLDKAKDMLVNSKTDIKSANTTTGDTDKKLYRAKV